MTTQYINQLWPWTFLRLWGPFVWSRFLSPFFPEASRSSTGLLTTSGQTRSRLLIVYKMSQVQLWSPSPNKSLSEMQTWGKSCFGAIEATDNVEEGSWTWTWGRWVWHSSPKYVASPQLQNFSSKCLCIVKFLVWKNNWKNNIYFKHFIFTYILACTNVLLQ